MNEALRNNFNKIKEYWNGRSKKQKIIMAGSLLFFFIAISLIIFLATRTTYVPLYSDLSPAEAGSIKESLDERGVPSELSNNGTTINVPEEMVDSLKVELAAEGIPKSGSIDYSFFSENAGFGTTDNEFNVMKLDAMQTELAELIKGIDGIKDAKVMINLPEKGIFVSDGNEEASASVVLNTEPGYQFNSKQINALYHLVSKSVPNLPTDNIVIMNQNFEYFDQESGENFSGDIFASQNDIKKQIERDVRHQVQNLLGTLMGQDKVVVSVTADIDFTQENREENLVEPVDEENMEGITISAQRITESYVGDGAQVGGVPQAEDFEDPLEGGDTYQQGAAGAGEYEKIEETINNEVNKIRREIVESPYKIRDLGIQVLVEPPDPENPASLSQDTIADIEDMLATIVRTTINKDTLEEELTDETIEDKIVVSVQQFNGKMDLAEEQEIGLPWWVYVIGGVLLAVIGLLIFLILRTRKRRQEEEDLEEMDEAEELAPEIPDLAEEQDTEDVMRRKQLEKLAKEKPEDFAKLLRTWLAED